MCKGIHIFLSTRWQNTLWFSVSSNLDYCFNWTQRDFANHNIDCGGLFENKSGTVAANTRALTRYKEARGLSHKLDKIKLDAENKAKQFSFTKKLLVGYKRTYRPIVWKY